MHFIRENPGCHLRNIKKTMDISIGTAQYHLSLLEKTGKITSFRRGFYKFYFLSGLFENNEKDILQVFRQETSREILLFVLENKNPTQTEIANKVGISRAAINWHINRLIHLNLLNEQRVGKYKRYQVPFIHYKYIISLLKSHYPSVWNTWSNRLVDLFLALSDEKE